MGRLDGKSAIITGAGSGIGRATSLLFAKEGADVVAFDKSDAVDETVAMIRAAGGNADSLKGDAGLEPDVIRLVDKAVSVFGRLDAVFANAGISDGRPPLQDQTAEQWAEVLRINLIGPWLAINHASRVMMKQGKGSIVCTASVAALRANTGGHAYSASKAGVVSLVQTSAHNLAGTGIRVNAICPGLIETGMTKSILDQARAKGEVDELGRLNPLRRYGVPSEIAHMALFLASDDASYVNGQAIPVDGGLSATLPHLMRR